MFAGHIEFGVVVKHGVFCVVQQFNDPFCVTPVPLTYRGHRVSMFELSDAVFVPFEDEHAPFEHPTALYQ